MLSRSASRPAADPDRLALRSTHCTSQPVHQPEVQPASAPSGGAYLLMKTLRHPGRLVDDPRPGRLLGAREDAFHPVVRHLLRAFSTIATPAAGMEFRPEGICRVRRTITPPSLPPSRPCCPGSNRAEPPRPGRDGLSVRRRIRFIRSALSTPGYQSDGLIGHETIPVSSGERPKPFFSSIGSAASVRPALGGPFRRMVDIARFFPVNLRVLILWIVSNFMIEDPVFQGWFWKAFWKAVYISPASPPCLAGDVVTALERLQEPEVSYQEKMIDVCGALLFLGPWVAGAPIISEVVSGCMGFSPRRIAALPAHSNLHGRHARGGPLRPRPVEKGVMQRWSAG